MLQHHEEAQPEARYDAQMQQQVIALASRLQNEQQETLTASQMEAISAEVGLDPVFLRQAIARITTSRRTRSSLNQTSVQLTTKAEFLSVMIALAFPLLWGTLAFITKTTMQMPPPPPFLVSGAPVQVPETVVNTTIATLFTLITPGPIAVIQGLLTGKKRLGFLAGTVLALALAPTFAYLLNISSVEYLSGNTFQLLRGMLAYLIFGVPVLGLLGTGGAWIRQRYFPFRPWPTTASQNISRADLLQQLFALQGQLEAAKEHRCFLSVDVVGSTEMKAHAADLAVEHSFGQYRNWVEEIARANGGEMQVAAGDGTMCMFARDVDAVRAARQLLDGLPQFNTRHNRLRSPFRIRCGISAGHVAIDAGTPIGHLQSAVLDRAAMLQKQAEPNGLVLSAELAAAGLTELGDLKPFPNTASETIAFRWSPQSA